jgi:septum formation protein
VAPESVRRSAAGAQVLILASRSPRRQELLQAEGIVFEVVPGAGDEPAQELGEDCAQYARRAATAKALEVAHSRPGRWTLGADTVVAVDGDALGKPADGEEARHMLQRLSGRSHEVCTGVALARADSTGACELRAEVAVTQVTFRPLQESEIATYVESGEPLDKAGAYGIQGGAGQFVSHVEGSYSNVVGLPLELVREMLQDVLSS